MVSIVGYTGSGKSTVVSFLSSNDTMFNSQTSSGGSTTIGAGISPLIPSKEYRLRMKGVLSQGPLYNTNHFQPLFLMDSEGISLGEDVDFVKTGPAAVVANIIVWITMGRMHPRSAEILTKIKSYMNVLDRITMGNTTAGKQSYREFIIVLMQGDDSDKDLLAGLFDWGSSDEENARREKTNKKFKEVALDGLPSVDNRVFLKNTFSKKIRAMPHVPLWGLYKAYPKAF